jgi:hypothetical protein
MTQESTYEVVICPPYGIDAIWGQVEGFLKEALVDGFPLYALDDIQAMCKNQSAVLGVVVKDRKEIVAAMTATITSYPKGNVAMILGVSGQDMSQWIEQAQDVMYEWAGLNHCVGIMAAGRQGWTRLAGMKNLGHLMYKHLGA